MLFRSYAEIKALCAGNPLIKEKMDLDVQVAKLKVLKADHQSQKFRLQDKLLTKFPADIQETNAYIAGVKADAQLADAHPQEKDGFCGMTIKGVTYDEKKTAGERLVLACSELPNAEEKVIGSYRGFELSLRFDAFRTEYQALLKGERKYTVPLGTDPLGNIIRLDNSLNNFPERITSAENELATLHQQQAAAQIEVEKPFPQEEELAEKSARLAELNAQLDVDEKSHDPEQDEEEQEDAPRRPSVLAALEEKSDKPEPVKPFRSEYQAILKGERRYPVALGTDPLGNIIRLDNSLNNFPERINSAENELATLHQQQAAAQIEVEKPFPQEEELAEKSARLAELNAQLDVDEKSHDPEQDEEEQEDAPRRPSVLAALEEKSDKPEPVKPFRSYYDKDGDAR